jgi:hypothetical protein
VNLLCEQAFSINPKISWRKTRGSPIGSLLYDVPSNRHPNKGEPDMKNRTASNNRKIRTAGAVMMAMAIMSTAACGGTNDVIESADAAVVEAAAPESVDSADSTVLTASDAEPVNSTQEVAPTPAPVQQAQAPAPAPTPAPAPASNVASADTPAPEQAPVEQQPEMAEPELEADAAPEAEQEPEMAEPEVEADAAPEAEQEPEMVEPEAEAQPEVMEPEVMEPEVVEPEAPAPVVSSIVASFNYITARNVQVRAEMTGFKSSRTAGIVSVCAVQYNEYGNPTSGPSGTVEVDGVRYPALLVEGCSPSTENYGVYSYTWSVNANRGTNGSLKNWYDVAIRAEDGQVKVYCIDMNARNAQFVERNMADYANRTKLGSCPS